MNTIEIQLFMQYPDILKLYKASDGAYFLNLRAVQAYATSIANGTFVEIPRPDNLPPLPTDPIPVNELWVKYPTLFQWKGDFAIAGNSQFLPTPDLSCRMFVYRIVTNVNVQSKELSWGNLESQKMTVGVGDFIMCTGVAWIKIEDSLRMTQLEASVATMTAQAGALVANYPNYFQKNSITLHVNQATGNDNNDGLTAATSLKTIGRASVVCLDKFYEVCIYIYGTYNHDVSGVQFENPKVLFFLQDGAVFTFKKINFTYPGNTRSYERLATITFAGSVEFRGFYWYTVRSIIGCEGITPLHSNPDGYEHWDYNTNSCAINVGTADYHNKGSQTERTCLVNRVDVIVGSNVVFAAGTSTGRNSFPITDSIVAKFREKDVVWNFGANAFKFTKFDAPTVLRSRDYFWDGLHGEGEIMYDSNFLYLKVNGVVKKVALKV
jgi:hypothetical protein